MANQIVQQREKRLKPIVERFWAGFEARATNLGTERVVQALEAAYTEGVNVALELATAMLSEPKATALARIMQGPAPTVEELKKERDRILNRAMEINRTLTAMAGVD